jgi:hypothetical protein
MCQSIAGCGNQSAEYELQAVVAHQGTPNKGHYIALLKPKGGPHWAKFDDAAVKWVQEAEVMDQEASMLVYIRPNHIMKDDIITAPDADVQEDGDPPPDRGMTQNNHSGSTTATSRGDRQDHREASNTLPSPASGDLPEVENQLYQELLERARPDPASQLRDLEEVMTGQPNKERQLQEDTRQAQELQSFQTYLHTHGLREEEVGAFGNCLFLSLAWHVQPMQKNVCLPTTSRDSQKPLRMTALTIHDRGYESRACSNRRGCTGIRCTRQCS